MTDNRDQEIAAEPEVTFSGLPIETTYAKWEGDPTTLGDPGEFPFTRGIYREMYRRRPWTIRQYAGFGSAEETNARYRRFMKEGQTGLSVAFDLPTQLGLDSNDPQAFADVGRVGVAVDSLRDFEVLFREIPLDRVSTSFTINATAPIILAMYIAVAEQQGVASAEISGTLQNDLLKEFAARGAWILPVKPSMRLVADVIEYSTKLLPRFNPISIAGAHFRDAGASAVQEAAFTLADGIAYTEELLRRGLPIDSFAHRLSFYFYTYTNIFEEVAKYRAMRRMWARIMRDRFGAQDNRSMMFRFGVVCGGKSLTREQPLNNVVRVAYGALASVLGGVQSVFTAAYDEAYAIPTEDSALLALRTQQILLEESGAASTVDPLAGSYFVESLTDEFERATQEIMAEIEEKGGMPVCVEDGTIQSWIADEAYRWAHQVENGTIPIVGVNKYIGSQHTELELFQHDEDLAERQRRALEQLLSDRDADACRRVLEDLRSVCVDPDENVMPTVLRAVKAYCTIGEIAGVMREVFGSYQEPSVI